MVSKTSRNQLNIESNFYENNAAMIGGVFSLSLFQTTGTLFKNNVFLSNYIMVGGDSGPVLHLLMSSSSLDRVKFINNKYILNLAQVSGYCFLYHEKKL